MKVTKSQLKQIIQEELEAMQNSITDTMPTILEALTPGGHLLNQTIERVEDLEDAVYNLQKTLGHKIT
jgi:uncharacterized protein (UPF0335 family)